jgi:hypothetical protein
MHLRLGEAVGLELIDELEIGLGGNLNIPRGILEITASDLATMLADTEL